MAWGRSTPPPPPPPRSAFLKSLPLIIFLIVLGIFAFVGYHIYLSMQAISTAASDKMQSKNVVFTKDGVKVGVKQLQNENYVDRTQSILVKAWNLSSWPGYKSRLWNQEAQQKPESRKP
ncbi:hypothetical protein BJ875DRAFT_385531 [Amylocarpus encephaloides]|uniref:Uncharacterized protein n=1 Tax=Amylocarpus encephaloides TaxID=45428 RepID=A0A9P7YAR3_9HELO|nr:hypothetical protein BJ875DRAFT_385531 [Amylocarpus encephaloides]